MGITEGRRCHKYYGECTVTDEFCARRHKYAISYTHSYYDDRSIECSLCATCQDGIMAFNNLMNNHKIMPKISKSKIGGINASKVKRRRKGQSPYSVKYIGGKP